jgi:hypothetical protein
MVNNDTLHINGDPNWTPIREITGGDAPMTPEETAEYKAKNARARQEWTRFYEIAPPDYWEAIDAVNAYRRMAADLANAGHADGARTYRRIASEIEALVFAKRDRLHQQIREEMES